MSRIAHDFNAEKNTPLSYKKENEHLPEEERKPTQ